ncbi:MAG: citrate lyase acyl carrier protein [Veillonellales bacterium]
MSKLCKQAQAGTLESSDILIMLAPAEPGTGIAIELISPAINQYGEHIEKLIAAIIKDHGIQDVIIQANDKGALDCTIDARVKTAIARALA